MSSPPSVVHVQTYALRVKPEPWAFAATQADAIRAHWQARLQQNPGFFNGPIHILHTWDLAGGHFTGDLLRTDFASFLYWREHAYPDKSVRDCFGSALLRSSDGRIILGRQSPGHINSGLTYFPGGFIDHRDIGPDGAADIQASVARETEEELGFPAGTFVAKPGAYLTFEGQLLSIAIDHVSHLDAAALLATADRFIASESDPELEAVVAVARRADFKDTAMPPFTRALLETLLP